VGSEMCIRDRASYGAWISFLSALYFIYVLVRIFGSAPGRLQWENFQIFYPQERVTQTYRFLKGERLPWEEFLVLLLLKKARVVAPAARRQETTLDWVMAQFMGKAPTVNYPRYPQYLPKPAAPVAQPTGEAPLNSSETTLRALPLALLTGATLADAPRPAQLGFQDSATEGFFSMGQLHHSIWVWLSLVLVLVFGLLGMTVYLFWARRNLFGLLSVVERLCLTEDTKLEFV
jgi:hypothetical protein